MIGESVLREAAPYLAMMDRAAEEIRDSGQRLATLETLRKRTANGLGWRGRLLGGILAADQEAGREYRRITREQRELLSAIRGGKAQRKYAAAVLDKLLAPHLGSVDPRYAALEEAKAALDASMRAAEKMLRLLVRALDDLRNASSSRASQRALAGTDSAARKASKSVRAVRDAAPRYARAVPDSDLPWTHLVTNFTMPSRHAQLKAMSGCEATVLTCLRGVRQARESLKAEQARTGEMLRNRLREGHRYLRA